MAISSQTARTIIDAYIALFNRAPDPLGLEYWGERLESGKSLSSIIYETMLNTDAARAFYPEGSSYDFIIDTFYRNALGREPDAEGKAFWLNMLNETQDVGSVLTQIVAVVRSYDGAHPDGIASANLFSNRGELASAYTAALAEAGITANNDAVMNITRSLLDAVSSNSNIQQLIADLVGDAVALTALAVQKPAVVAALIPEGGKLSDLMDNMPAGSTFADLLKLATNLAENSTSAAEITDLIPEDGDFGDFLDSLPEGTTAESLIDAAQNGSAGLAELADSNTDGDDGDDGDTDGEDGDDGDDGDTDGEDGDSDGDDGDDGDDDTSSTFNVIESGTAPNKVVAFANASGVIEVTAKDVEGGVVLEFKNGGKTVATTAKTDEISEIKVTDGLTLTGDAGALHSNKVTGAGNVEISGADGAQTIEVLTTGDNWIEGGKGADQITLGDGADTVVVNSGDANTAPVVAGVNTAGTAGVAAVAAVLTFDLSGFTDNDAVVFTVDGESSAPVDLSGSLPATVTIDGVAYVVGGDATNLTLTQPAGSEAPVAAASAAQAGSNATGSVETDGVTAVAATADFTVYADVVSVLTAGDTIAFTYQGTALTATIGTISDQTATAAEVQSAIDTALTDTSGGSAAGAAGDVVATFDGTHLKLTVKTAGDTLTGGDFTDADGVIASDSNISDMDIITHFDLANDKLLLSGDKTLLHNEDPMPPFAITNGVVNGVTGTFANIEEKVAYIAFEVFIEMDDTTATAAYYDGTDTYIFQGDGVEGKSDADIVIKLAGVDATGSLDTILI